MKRSLLQNIGYLFAPEESLWKSPQRVGMRISVRKRSSRVSIKALFWVGMSLVIGMMLARLS
jgi:hypothetical protein